VGSATRPTPGRQAKPHRRKTRGRPRRPAVAVAGGNGADSEPPF